MYKASLLLLFLLMGQSAQGEDVLSLYQLEAVPKQPKIGVVLGGGGAKGAAHIGVLKTLEAMHIPIDYIAGTSMGAYVAGLYALGYRPEHIEQLMLNLDWQQGYNDQVARQDLSLRRKHQQDRYPIQTQLGFDGSDFKFPKGVLQGQAMASILRDSLGPLPRFTSFNQFWLPYRAVATDLVKMQPVILAQGDLLLAMQASMAVPGVLRPIPLGDQLLVDGGVVNNLPIDVVRAMGADIVIAVDVGSPLLAEAQIDSAVAVVDQLTNFLTRNSTEKQLASLTEQDVLLRPQIDDVGTADFAAMPGLIHRGEAAAVVKAPQLQLLVDHTRFAEQQQRRQQFTAQLEQQRPKHIAGIEIVGLPYSNERVVRRVLDLPSQGEFSALELQQAIDRLYHTDLFERVDYQFIPREEGNVLQITPVKKQWGPGFIDLRLAISDDFSNNASVDLGASFSYEFPFWLGGQWYNELSYGNNRLLKTELYLPFGERNNIDFSTGYLYRNLNYEFHTDNIGDGQTAAMVLPLDYTRQRLWGSLGYSFSPTFAISSGIELLVNDINTDVIALSQDQEHYWAWYQKLEFDSLDDLQFPVAGQKAQLNHRRIVPHVSDQQFSVIEFSYFGVASWQRHSLLGKLDFAWQLNSDFADNPESYVLGGFFNLSGYQQDQLLGRSKALAAVSYRYRLADNDLGLFKAPVFLGFTLERGGVVSDDLWSSEMVNAFSIYAGVNTPLGPLTLAWGRNNREQQALYLLLANQFAIFE